MAIIVGQIMAEEIDLGTSTSTQAHAGGGDVNGNQVNLATFSRAGAGGSATAATWNPSSIANGAEATTDVTVPGATLGDFALVSSDIDVADLSLTAQVTATDTVTVQLLNLTGAAVDLGSINLKILVFTTP